jgi:hypothetical protein
MTRHLGAREPVPPKARRGWGEDHYILQGHLPVLTTDVRAWGRWMAPENAPLRWVAGVTLAAPHGWTPARVATVFLGVDQNPGLDPEDETPRLFETRVFGGPIDRETARCATWDEAVEQHARMVARVKKLLAVL